MRRTDVGVIAGLLLVGLGILLLLETLEIVAWNWGVTFALLFGAGGIVFLAVYARQTEQWWALIPGFVLLGLGALIGLSAVVPGVGEAWGGALFLGSISLPFWVIYLTRRKEWWALIPAGSLLTLAVVAAVSQLAEGGIAGGVFFLGLAATFGLIYVLPTPEGKMTWAAYPALALLTVGAIVLVASTSLLRFLGPAVLILLGIALAYRALRSR